MFPYLVNLFMNAIKREYYYYVQFIFSLDAITRSV